VSRGAPHDQPHRDDNNSFRGAGRRENIVSDKTARPTQRTTSDAHAASIQDEVQERAYYRYVERGRTDGRALEDWLAAESEIRQASSQSES